MVGERVPVPGGVEFVGGVGLQHGVYCVRLYFSGDLKRVRGVELWVILHYMERNDDRC